MESGMPSVSPYCPQMVSHQYNGSYYFFNFSLNLWQLAYDRTLIYFYNCEWLWAERADVILYSTGSPMLFSSIIEIIAPGKILSKSGLLMLTYCNFNVIINISLILIFVLIVLLHVYIKFKFRYFLFHLLYCFPFINANSQSSSKFENFKCNL